MPAQHHASVDPGADRGEHVGPFTGIIKTQNGFDVVVEKVVLNVANNELTPNLGDGLRDQAAV